MGWIGCVRDELVLAGYPAGDRTVALANLRALKREREALRAALAKYGRHDRDCSRNWFAPLPTCDCGLDALLAAPVAPSESEG